MSGALGAVVAEVLGEFLVANASKRLPELYAQAAAQGPVSRKAIDDLYQEEIKKAIDWSHIGAAGAALVAGQDVNLAARAADNALSYNLGPSVLIGAYMVGSTAWTAYDVYDTYQKEGMEAALAKLVMEGIITVVAGAGFKVAGKLYPTAELAWAAAVKQVPFLQEMGHALGSVGSKVQGTFVKKAASTKPASSMKAPPVSKATEKSKKSQKGDKVEKAPKADKVEKVSKAEPKSSYQAQQHKRDLREEMGKPHAEDPKLARRLEKLHKVEDNCVGSGSTAAAVRQEIRTGQPVNGKFHTQKAQDGIKFLEKWLKNNPTARPGDRAAAENMLADLKDALSTIKGGQ